MPKKTKKCCEKPKFTHVITKYSIPVSVLEKTNGGIFTSSYGYVTYMQEYEYITIYCENCGTIKEN